MIRFVLAGLMAVLFFPQQLFAQTDSQPCPDVLLTPPAEVVEMPAFDVAAAWLRAEKEAEENGQYLYGVVQPFEVDPAPERTWRSRCGPAFARSLRCGLHFSDFHLPAGAQLGVTNLDGPGEGPYDFRDNDAHGRIATGDVPGEWVVLRLQAPAPLMGQVHLGMEGAAALFRDVEAARGGSQPCEVDVACPEIQGWECQRDATVRLSIIENGGSFLCSGAMVNTTALDCRQYMLTALHARAMRTTTTSPCLKCTTTTSVPNAGRAMAS